MPNFVTASEACALIDVSRQRLNQLVNAGWVRRAARGRYEMRDVLRGYISFLKRPSEKSQAATQLDEIKIRKIELEILRRESQLVPRDDVLMLIDRTVAEVEAAAPNLYRRLAGHLRTDDERARMRGEVDAYVSDVRAVANKIRGELQ